jgi:hypothetical protein
MAKLQDEIFNEPSLLGKTAAAHIGSAAPLFTTRAQYPPSLSGWGMGTSVIKSRDPSESLHRPSRSSSAERSRSIIESPSDRVCCRFGQVSPVRHRCMPRGRVSMCHATPFSTAPSGVSKTDQLSITGAESFRLPGPRLDHEAVIVSVSGESIGQMPPLYALRAPVR